MAHGTRAMETYRYRGYQIEPRREWSNLVCQRDLPIMPHSTLRTLTARKEEAVTEAKQRIDHILSK